MITRINNGTFRGFNLAFVTAASSLDFWVDKKLENDVNIKAKHINDKLQLLSTIYSPHITETRGRGFIQGLCFFDKKIASAISKIALDQGLLIETSGLNDEVLKLLPPLTISRNDLERGLSIIDKSIDIALSSHKT